MKHPSTPLAALLLLSAAAIAQGPSTTDIFGRDLAAQGIVLVDWEGHMANPAIQLWVHPPPAAAFPATATLAGDDQRLYFDDPGIVSGVGPRKTITFNDANPLQVSLSIFPDRDGTDEIHRLDIAFLDAMSVVSDAAFDIHVIDQDINAPPSFPITVDYSRDVSGFFGVANLAAIMQQAAVDWAYFLLDPGFDPVTAGAEQTFIWNFPLAFTVPGNGQFIPNTQAYTGFLLYAYGINTPWLRSGGEPSSCCLQSVGGLPTSLRRSGGVEIETSGNFNTMGWLASIDPDQWWMTGNLANEVNDLYSIARHSMGHALAFNSDYPLFASGEHSGFSTPEILAYYGSPLIVDATMDHFTNIVDPASQRGIFGNEYGGSMPARRWLITKLDLLLLEAMGYTLRPTSSLENLEGTANNLDHGTVGIPYSGGATASGGIPTYDWTVSNGQFPPGLNLNRFTGEISGTPTIPGTYSFTLLLQDHSAGPGISFPTTLRMYPGAAFDPFGTGCLANSTAPVMETTDLPWVGEPFTINFSQLPLPPALPYIVLGFSDTAWGPFSLPQDLGLFGFPGCTQYVSVDFAQPLTNAAGTASWTIDIPLDLSLPGLAFFNQGIVLFGLGQAAVTNAARGQVGGPR